VMTDMDRKEHDDLQSGHHIPDELPLTRRNEPPSSNINNSTTNSNFSFLPQGGLLDLIARLLVARDLERKE